MSRFVQYWIQSHEDLCTIRQNYPILLHRYLIVFSYDFNEILDVLNNYVRSIEEDSWEKVAEKIGRIARWEFEGYQP